MNYSVMRILVITEGKLRTDRSSDGIGAMLDAVECWRSEITKDLFRITRVQINEDDAWLDLADAIQNGGYDQIWLFGSGSPTNEEFRRRPLSGPELAALRNFMDAGGGVFATGDHEDVGASLCGRIPRVRHMRSWGERGFTPSKNDRSRADTMFASRFKGDSDSEEDAVGKPIWVKCIDKQPHPLLQGYTPPAIELPEGRVGPARAASPAIIRWLPDHMHEGECRILPQGFDAEIRADFKEGAQTEVVAWSMKRGFSDEMGLTEDEPSLHGVVCCYDGLSHGVGRVVVDSTFHHWVEHNTAAMRSSPIGRDLDCYPVNIARWLSKAMNDGPKLTMLLYALGAHRDVVRVRKYKPFGLTEQQYNEVLGETAESVWAANGMSVLVLRETLERVRTAEKSKAWMSGGGTGAANVGAAIGEGMAAENVLRVEAEPSVAYSAVPKSESAKVPAREPAPLEEDIVENKYDVEKYTEVSIKNLAEKIPPVPVIPYEAEKGTETAKSWARTGRLLDKFLESSNGPAYPD